MNTSRFFIVNAGAGAHDNITLRGYRILQQADLVIASDSQRQRFADELAGKQVIDGGHGLFDDLALRRLDPDEATRQQDAIRQRIEAAHAAGQTIVLLESGDAALAQSLLHDQDQRLQLSGLAAFMQASRDCLPDCWVLFCMGLDLPRLIDQARALYPADTAMALVLNAGYPDCEVIRCSVGDLDRLADREIAFPYCLIYIGLDPG